MANNNELWNKVKENTQDIPKDQQQDFQAKWQQEQENINKLCQAAEQHQEETLAQLGEQLKTGFVKTYLLYG